ncbi:MAG: aminotransferase class IV family protein [Micromonosporaceae bacterium]|nr:aminotransferase class IV family protein [Micromonosporaceae bacterium]
MGTATLVSMAELDGAPVHIDELQALALTNYGHFTSMRVEDLRIRGLSHHLERLVRDCRTLFGVELDRERVRDHVRHALGERGGVFVVRVTVFDPAVDLGRPAAADDPRVLVTIRPAMNTPPPLRVQSFTYVRDFAAVKHVGLFGPLWHRRTAQLNGFDDAVFSDADSYIAEGPTWNVGFFDGEQVIWPNAEVLPGITMRLLQQVHDRTSVAPVHLRDLARMCAVFATNTTVGVRPIAAVDDAEFPDDHPIFHVLRKEYEEIPAEIL